MTATDDRQPTQAIPARTVAMYFTCPDVYVGATKVALSTISPRFASLLSQRASSLEPRRFVGVQTLQPWPNNLLIIGSITNPNVTTSLNGKCSIQLPMTMELGEADPGGTVATLFDGHQDVAKGSVVNPPTDPDGFFDAITPILNKYFDELLGEFAKNSKFNTYQWGTTVTAIDSATTITIGAGTNSNLEIGNLLEVARPSDNGKEYSGIALVEVTEVSEATCKCFYYGAGNQPALVQDGIFVADVQKLLLGQSGSKSESRVASANGLLAASEAPARNKFVRPLQSSSGPFTVGVQIVLGNGSLMGLERIAVDNSLTSVVNWIYVEIWMFNDVAGGSPAQVPSVVLTIESYGANSPWDIDLPLTFVKGDQVPTIFPPPEIGLVDHYLGSMPINFNLGPAKTALITFSRNSGVQSSAAKVMFVGSKQ